LDFRKRAGGYKERVGTEEKKSRNRGRGTEGHAPRLMTTVDFPGRRIFYTTKVILYFGSWIAESRK
jgi:hypothetical protein